MHIESHTHTHTAMNLLMWNLRYFRMLLEIGINVQHMQAMTLQPLMWAGPPGSGGRVVCLMS